MPLANTADERIITLGSYFYGFTSGEKRDSSFSAVDLLNLTNSGEGFTFNNYKFTDGLTQGIDETIAGYFTTILNEGVIEEVRINVIDILNENNSSEITNFLNVPGNTAIFFKNDAGVNVGYFLVEEAVLVNNYVSITISQISYFTAFNDEQLYNFTLKFASTSHSQVFARRIDPNTLNEIIDEVNGTPTFEVENPENLLIKGVFISEQGVVPFVTTTKIYQLITKPHVSGSELYTGSLGLNGQQINFRNLELIHASNSNSSDIQDLDDTVTIDFSNIGSTVVLDHINNLTTGIALVNPNTNLTLIRATVNGLRVEYLYTGIGDTYGTNDSDISSDELLLIEAETSVNEETTLTITTTENFNASDLISGLSQKGKVVIINNGTSNIVVTIDLSIDTIYVKKGIGKVSFVSSNGRLLKSINGYLELQSVLDIARVVSDENEAVLYVGYDKPQKCKNIYDLDKNTQGVYILPDGNIGISAGNQATPFIPILGNVQYASNEYITHLAYYDSDRTLISSFAENPGRKKFTTPSNAAFVRFSSFDALMNVMQFEIGYLSTSFQDYCKNVSGCRNLYNFKTNTLNKYVQEFNGALGDSNDRQTSDFIEIKSSTNYISSSAITHFAWYNENFGFISGDADQPGFYNFLAPSNAKYIRISGFNAFMIDNFQFEEGLSSTDYVPFCEENPSVVKETTITVSIDGNTDFVGRNSIQDAINSIPFTSKYDTYVIKIKNGFYFVLNGSEYKGSPTYPAMITMRDYVSLEGESEHGVIIHAELPPDDNDIDTNLSRNLHQTVWNYAKEATIKNLTLVGKNIRYTIHQDDIRSSNSSRYYENVTTKYEGALGFLRTWGLGTFSGEVNYLKNVTIDSSSTTFTCHGNSAFTKESNYFFDNVVFNTSSYDSFALEASGSILDNRYDFKGCKMPLAVIYKENWLKANPSLGQTYFDHSEVKITGNGNTPFLFQNIVAGLSLMITSDTEGSNANVFFDQNSSAFTDLIKDSRFNVGTVKPSLGNLYFADGYYIKEGSTGLKPSSFGGVDLTESAALLDSGVNYRSMGKRLGDCSVTSKTLSITINGVDFDVVFNSDYTSVSNDDILAEINTVISDEGVASLYNHGRTYYPEMTDCVGIYKNTTSSLIVKGSVVEIQGNGIKLSNSWDENTGIALEDIPVPFATAVSSEYGKGRILVKGLIYNSNVSTASHFVNVDGPTVEGDKMKVVNGALKKDTSGSVEAITLGLIKIGSSGSLLGLVSKKKDKKIKKPISASTYTILATDINKYLEFSNACVVTVPDGLSADLEFQGEAVGSGAVTFTATTTLNVFSGYIAECAGQYANFFIRTKGSNISVLTGNLKLGS